MTTAHMYRYLAPKIARPVADQAKFDQVALALWCAGRDTYDIAIALGVPESQVANQLPRLLDQLREERQWQGVGSA